MDAIAYSFWEINFKIPESLTKLMRLFASYITAQEMEFSIKDSLSKCNQIRRKLKKSYRKIPYWKTSFLCSIICCFRDIFWYLEMGFFPLIFPT